MNESINVNIEEMMKVRFEKRETVFVVGVKGAGPKDQKRLFEEMNTRGHEIVNKKSENIYIVTGLHGLIIAHEVSEFGTVPEGMVSFTIPADEYAICFFEEKYIGSFWSQLHKDPVKSKYNLSMEKPRYEILAEHLQPIGVTEIYVPTNGSKHSA